MLGGRGAVRACMRHVACATDIRGVCSDGADASEG